MQPNPIDEAFAPYDDTENRVPVTDTSTASPQLSNEGQQDGI
jgi:hypothetical protein